MKIWSILNEMLQRYIWLQMYLYWVEHLITWIAFTFMHKCWTLRDRNRQSWSDSFTHFSTVHTHTNFHSNIIKLFVLTPLPEPFISFGLHAIRLAMHQPFYTALHPLAGLVLFYFIFIVCVCVCVSFWALVMLDKVICCCSTSASHSLAVHFVASFFLYCCARKFIMHRNTNLGWYSYN